MDIVAQRSLVHRYSTTAAGGGLRLADRDDAVFSQSVSTEVPCFIMPHCREKCNWDERVNQRGIVFHGSREYSPLFVRGQRTSNADRFLKLLYPGPEFMPGLADRLLLAHGRCTPSNHHQHNNLKPGHFIC